MLRILCALVEDTEFRMVEEQTSLEQNSSIRRCKEDKKVVLAVSRP